jgi:hypothetical protein
MSISRGIAPRSSVPHVGHVSQDVKNKIGTFFKADLMGSARAGKEAKTQ